MLHLTKVKKHIKRSLRLNIDQVKRYNIKAKNVSRLNRFTSELELKIIEEE